MNDFPGILNLIGSLNLVHCLHYMAFIRMNTKTQKQNTVLLLLYSTPGPVGSFWISRTTGLFEHYSPYIDLNTLYALTPSLIYNN